MFIGVSDRQEARGNIRKLKEKKRIEEDIQGYKKWMDRAGVCVCVCVWVWVCVCVCVCVCVDVGGRGRTEPDIHPI